MRRDIFVETGQVAALRGVVTSAMEIGAGFPGMVMAYGEAGTGKTWAARALYTEYGGVYLRIRQGMTQSAFLQALCFELTGQEPHGSARCMRLIVKKLEEKPVPIFLDEPEKLDTDRFENMRDIHDETGAPIIAAGEMALLAKVSSRSRLDDRFPQAFRVPFGKISIGDVLLYLQDAASLALSPEAAKVVHAHTKGNFRRVYNAALSLESAAKAAETFDINADMVRAVLKVGAGGQRS